MQSCVDFLDKSYETLGSALTLNMDCAYKSGGANSSTVGLA
jgi:hypothetical protein